MVPSLTQIIPRPKTVRPEPVEEPFMVRQGSPEFIEGLTTNGSVRSISPWDNLGLNRKEPAFPG